MEIEGYFIYESEVDHMKKNICTTAEEIKKKFIDDGWSKDISFYELTLEEAKILNDMAYERYVTEGMFSGSPLKNSLDKIKKISRVGGIG